MQIKYFQTAWNDIKNSPGWFGKLCLLALVNCIPIFGQIVIFGYLYGWAREIAWGTHQPMPAKIICNEDGKFWRRGWFAFVLPFVFGLVPAIIASVGSGMQTSGTMSVMQGGNGAMAMIGTLLYWIGILAALAVGIFAWIGNMRMSIYDRLSAGFQVGKLLKMFRYDTNGIMRIFGMRLLVGMIVGIIVWIVMVILLTIALLAGVSHMAAAGYDYNSLQYMSDAQAARFVLQLIGSTGVIGILSMIVCVFAYMLAAIWVEMLCVRAMGYWTMQFSVAQWRGQDDPMPFEMAPANTAGQPYGAQPYGSQPYGAQPYDAQPYGVQPPMAQPYGAQTPMNQPGQVPQGAPVQQGVPPYAAQPAAGQPDYGQAVVDQPAVEQAQPQPEAEAQPFDVQPDAQDASDASAALQDSASDE